MEAALEDPAGILDDERAIAVEALAALAAGLLALLLALLAGLALLAHAGVHLCGARGREHRGDIAAGRQRDRTPQESFPTDPLLV
jgi:hypothetical protein